MFDTWRQFFASSNGDRWFLGTTRRDRPRDVVGHRANQPSGGAETLIEVADFLEKDVGSPQRDALIEILAPTGSEAEQTSCGKIAAGPMAAETAAPYEPGMEIIWDVLTREVFVIFRGTAMSAGQGFETREQGIAEGERICRNSGWDCGPDSLASLADLAPSTQAMVLSV